MAAVHDLSCVGRCALTVIIPALAAMGIQPIPLPTAVLSTHTGGYQGIAVRDLTDFLPECIEHWMKLGLRTDAVYSGYLAGIRQAEMVRTLASWQREAFGARIIVDPVMGDGGRMYSAIPEDMPEHMLALCNEANLITPNLTEAALMLNLRYPEAAVDHQTLMTMLSGFKAETTVITSVPLPDGRYANVFRTRSTGETFLCAYERVPLHYPGTGDLFTAVMTGYLLQGKTPSEAMQRATAFLRRVIEDTGRDGGEVRAGVHLEKALRYLCCEELPGPLPEIERID